MEDENIVIKSKEGDLVEFDAKIKKLTNYFDQVEGNEIHLEISPKFALEFIKKFCEAHNYNESGSSIKFVYPWKNGNLQQHVDPISYELCKQFDMTGKSEEETFENIKTFGPILETTCILGLVLVRKVLNTTLQIPWYCGDKENDLNEYLKKWQYNEKDEEQQEHFKQIRKEHKPIFVQINKQYLEDLERLLEGNNDLYQNQNQNYQFEDDQNQQQFEEDY